MSRWGIAFRVPALFVMTLARRVWNFLDLATLNASAVHPREVNGTAGSPFFPPALGPFTEGRDRYSI
jgi:hypothetical protein